MPSAASATHTVLRKPKLTTFYWNYSPAYDYSSRLKQLIDEANPLQFPVRARYEKKPHVGLWWSAGASTNPFPHAILRSHVKKRIRRAFTQALVAEGLDENGVKQSPKRPGVAEEHRAEEQSAGGSQPSTFSVQHIEAPPPPINLFGTLFLMARPEISDVKHATIQEDAGKLVRYLMRLAHLKDSGPSSDRVRLSRSRQYGQSSRIA